MLTLGSQNAWRERYAATHPGWRPATELYAERVRACLRPDGRLLDLGCGRGGLVEQLDLPLRVIGIDPDFASLREHRLPELPRAAGLSGQLPFAPESFHVVAASWLLEHLDDPVTTLGQIGRVLRPGGAFVFITPNGRHPLAWVNRAAGRLGQAQGRLVDRLYGRAGADTFPTYYRANSVATLEHLSFAAGLRLETLDFVADPTYLAFTRTMYWAMSAIEDRLPTERRIHLVGVMRRPPIDTSGDSHGQIA